MAEKKKIKLTREYLNVNLRKSDVEFIEKLVRIHPWTRQRTNPLRGFLINLMKWIKYHDKVLEDSEKLSQWDKRYFKQFYKVNRQNNFYPLPMATMRPWNQNYLSILKCLIEIGFIKKNKFKYSRSEKNSEKGRCRYFQIDNKIDLNAIGYVNDVKNLIDSLKELNFGQSNIAKALNKNRSTISRWFSSEQEPRKKDLDRIRNFISEKVQFFS